MAACPEVGDFKYPIPNPQSTLFLEETLLTFHLIL
jgi:hypothetical protein